MSDKNNGGAVVSNTPLHSPQSAILAIINIINYLQPEGVLVDSTAGQLLQMCKAELLQTLAVEATTSALRHGAAQINATFASLSQAYASDAALCERRGAEICSGADGVGQRNCDRTTE